MLASMVAALAVSGGAGLYSLGRLHERRVWRQDMYTLRRNALRFTRDVTW